MAYKEPEIKKFCKGCSRNFIAWTDRIVFCSDECKVQYRLSEINSLNAMWNKAIKNELTLRASTPIHIEYSPKTKSIINRLFKRVGSKPKQQAIRDSRRIILNPEAIEEMVWKLYIDHGSLRKALAAIPEHYAPLFDLKRVHCIVKKYQWLIKKQLGNDI